MSTTFILTDVDSGLTSQGTAHNKKAQPTAGLGTSLDIILSGGGAGSAAWYTEPSVPNLTTWPAGDYTVSADIDAAGADITYTLSLRRVNSAGVLQQTLGTSGTLSGTGLKSFTVNVASPITTAAGDRLVGVLSASRGASHGNQTLTISVNGANDKLIGAWTEAPTAFELDAQPGSYATTGVAAGLVAGFVLAAEVAAYSVAGVVAGFNVEQNAVPGSYSVAGAAVGLVSSYVENAAPGAYAQTGQVATFALEATADPGVYALTGVVADLEHTGGATEFLLDAQPGSYALTGAAAGLVANYLFDAQPGSYGVTGAAAGLVGVYVLAADPGGFALTGIDADFAYVGGGVFELNAEPGVYVIVGVEATFVYAAHVPHILACLTTSPPYYLRALRPQGNADFTIDPAAALRFASLAEAQAFAAQLVTIVSRFGGLNRGRVTITRPLELFGCVPVPDE